MLKATIHGSRKKDEKPSYLHHHVPKRAHSTKGKSGSTATRTHQSCSPRHRSKARSAHDFTLHGGREASCTVLKKSDVGNKNLVPMYLSISTRVTLPRTFCSLPEIGDIYLK